ncbi:MAG: glycosyltransferase family 39 protein, partial [Myxococcales bacterium]|nr:glycosyltransferase family 39 protein [Myxococcales bacterium]
MTGPPGRTGPGSASAPVAAKQDDALFGALLFVAALALRLWAALTLAGEPVWDGHYYDFGARRIAAGLGYSDDRQVAGATIWHPWCHYPVGYSALLALFYRLFGADHAVAGVANALVGAALAGVTWKLSARALSPGRARIAGAIVALHPGLVLNAAVVMSEPLAALGTLVAFSLATRDRDPRRGVVAGGLALGLGALVRPQAPLCAPFLACVVPGSWRARASWAAAACALALLPVLPWTVRNCRVMDGCALVSTNGGWNLAIGAFPRATGRFETLRSSDGCRDVTGQVQQDRCWLAYGLEQIRERPWRWLSLVPAKLGFTFDHESFQVEYLHEARPESWPEGRRLAAREATTVAHRLLVGFAALGAVAFPLASRARDSRPARAQLLLLGLVVVLLAVGLSADSPAVWPLAVFVSIVPWLPI